MKYPLENLASDKEFEDLVSLICERILGMGTIVFSVGKDGGKDAKFSGTANKFPSETNPWNGKIIIQAKHTQRPNASCSDSDFQRILKNEVIPAIKKLIDNDEINYYLLFTNRKLSGIQYKKIEDLFNEQTNIENRLIGKERIDLWLEEYPEIAKILNLNRLLLPLEFNEEDLKEIVLSFSKLDVKKGDLPNIPEERDIEKKNDLNKLSKNYFDNVIKKNMPYFEQISNFLSEPNNKELLNKYENTIGDLNEEITIHRDEYNKFEIILNHLYKMVLNKFPELNSSRALVRVFLHYMYYNCDIGKNE
ncbi:MAG TPA: hypothetical protein ENK44_09620 [Caldithrix abyssi]|uniref:ABC-three component systems C-terminal domain-containing protein n=1 Tax=Caldithrix abyssi TaxID=187145 RepID=A0A7V4U122_CALAY|nr:hypothetical protein [Caldithrix abyssi]